MGYNSLAPFYDAIASFVFGGAIQRAHHQHMDYWPKAGKILIVGGGTGKFLKSIKSSEYKSSQIDYVDASDAMINKAKQYCPKGLKVSFIAKSIMDHEQAEHYDLIFTPFFLDNFDGVELQAVFTKLNQLLSTSGSWVIADFHIGSSWYKKVWQNTLLWLMLRFFKICCHIKANKLEDFHQYFTAMGFERLAYQSFYSGFIFSSVYKKNVF